MPGGTITAEDLERRINQVRDEAVKDRSTLELLKGNGLECESKIEDLVKSATEAGKAAGKVERKITELGLALRKLRSRRYLLEITVGHADQAIRNATEASDQASSFISLSDRLLEAMLAKLASGKFLRDGISDGIVEIVTVGAAKTAEAVTKAIQTASAAKRKELEKVGKDADKADAKLSSLGVDYEAKRELAHKRRVELGEQRDKLRQTKDSIEQTEIKIKAAEAFVADSKKKIEDHRKAAKVARG